MPNFQNKGRKEDTIPKKQNSSDREDFNFLASNIRSLEGIKVRFDQSETHSLNSNAEPDLMSADGLAQQQELLSELFIPIPRLRTQNTLQQLGCASRNDRSLEGIKVRFDQSETHSSNSNAESALMNVGSNQRENVTKEQEYLSKLFTQTSPQKTQNILEQLGYGSSDVSELSLLIKFDPNRAQPVNQRAPNILGQEVLIPKKGQDSETVPCRIKWRKEDEPDKGFALIRIDAPPKWNSSEKKKTNTSCSKNEILKEELPKDLGVDQESIVARLKEYCLNSRHEKGKEKARVFTSALGITQAGAEHLAEQYQLNVDECNSIYEQKDGYGIVAEQYAKMTGVDGKTAWVKIVWMADYEKNADGTCRKECKTPWRLLTSYVETNQNILSKLEEKGKSE